MSQIRIKSIANLIENVNIVLDIGSDHALLSILLINENRAQHVINVEKNDLPFQNSVNATRAFSQQITNKKSNGFDNLEPFIFIDICTIMGMGGATIIKILNNATSRNVKKYILQPNNNELKVRQWVKENNWKINFEDLIKENNIIYELFVLSRTEGYVPHTKEEQLFGKINLIKNKDIFKEKWNKRLEKIVNNNLNQFNSAKGEELNLIKEVLKNASKTTSKFS